MINESVRRALAFVVTAALELIGRGLLGRSRLRSTTDAFIFQLQPNLPMGNIASVPLKIIAKLIAVYLIDRTLLGIHVRGDAETPAPYPETHAAR